MNFQSLNELNNASSNRIVVSRIKRIIEKYPEVWRVLHEPIQNSMDAIQKRADLENGIINVEINIKDGIVRVDDNGLGFPQDLSLLLPDGTSKTDQSETLGYQGVGLKSVIYSSQKFSLFSHTLDDEKWGVVIENASNYISTDGQESAPIISPEETRDQIGTTIEVHYGNTFVVTALEQIVEGITSSESNFKWRFDSTDFIKNHFFLKEAKTKKAIFEYMLKYYLRTQSYVGSISRLLNCRLCPNEEVYAKRIKIQFSIDFTGADSSSVNNPFLKQLIQELKDSTYSIVEFEVDNEFLDFQEIVEQIRSQDSRAISFRIYDFDIPSGGIMNDPTLMDQIYCKIMVPDYTKPDTDISGRYKQYISLLQSSNPDRAQKNIRQFTSLFPKILGIYILIGRMEFFEKYLGNNYGVKLIAANGVPTQHELTARSSNQSFYFNPITFIINVDGKLNEGKTHLIDDTLQRQCVKFFREIFESTLNRIAQEFVRTVPHDPPSTPINMVPLKPININGLDIKREPVDEDTLIAMFYQLLRIKGFQIPTYGLMRSGIFDGKFVYRDDNINSDNDLKNLEMKVKLTNLLSDFESPNNPKDFDKCDLIIVWDDSMTNLQQQDWRLVNRDAVPTISLQRSMAPTWITTLLKDRRNMYKPIIILKEWVKDLDPNFTT
jgi:hypothetical protein